MAQIHQMAELRVDRGAEYVRGLRAAVSAAIDYCLAILDHAGENVLPPPAPLLWPARLAARNGVPLVTVVRRYTSGFALLTEYVLQDEQSQVKIDDVEVLRLLHGPTNHFERLLAAVTDEYRRELDSRPVVGERRRVELVERFLGGDVVGGAELAYDFDGWHVALIARGSFDVGALRGVARQLDRRLLVVKPHPEAAWAWLGGRRKLEVAKLVTQMEALRDCDGTFAIGEPGLGRGGWRLSHKQARAVLPVAGEPGRGVVCYVEFALIASLFRDEVLRRSLEQLYLAPLGDERDGGESLRETLAAYFSSGRNITSASAALSISRQTVRSRLRAIEQKTGRAIDAHGAEIELALKLREHGALFD